MKPQKYNWLLMVRDTMDAAFMSQAAMSDKLDVSQQSVSNWLNGTRNPGAEIKPELLKLAQDAGLDIGRYESNPDFDRLINSLKESEAGGFVRIAELYGRMGRAARKKIMGYAENRL
jgi:transcriptional regulator with XRE-family HTH domain